MLEKTRMRKKEREKIENYDVSSYLYCAIFTFREKDERGTLTWTGRSQIL